MEDFIRYRSKLPVGQDSGVVNNRPICPNVFLPITQRCSHQPKTTVCCLPVSVYSGKESDGNHVLEAGAKANPLWETRSLCAHTRTHTRLWSSWCFKFRSHWILTNTLISKTQNCTYLWNQTGNLAASLSCFHTCVNPAHADCPFNTARK